MLVRIILQHPLIPSATDSNGSTATSANGGNLLLTVSCCPRYLEIEVDDALEIAEQTEV